VTVEHEWAQIRAPGIDRRRKAGTAASNDEDILHANELRRLDSDSGFVGTEQRFILASNSMIRLPLSKAAAAIQPAPSGFESQIGGRRRAVAVDAFEASIYAGKRS
jgi:hypothetical protein